jgi:hypothetical protein
MSKLSTTIVGIILSLLLLTVGYALTFAVQISASYTLYGTETGTAISTTTYGTWALASTGTAASSAYYKVDNTGAANNATMNNSTIIALSNFAAITIPAGTWTITYYGCTNQTSSAKFVIGIQILDSAGNVNTTICSVAATQYNNGPSAFLTATNASYTGAAITTSLVSIPSSGYLKVTWYVCNTGTNTLLTYLDEDKCSIVVTFTSGVGNSYGTMVMVVGAVAFFGIILYTINSVIKTKGGKKD